MEAVVHQVVVDAVDLGEGVEGGAEISEVGAVVPQEAVVVDSGVVDSGVVDLGDEEVDQEVDHQEAGASEEEVGVAEVSVDHNARVVASACISSFCFIYCIVLPSGVRCHSIEGLTRSSYGFNDLISAVTLVNLWDRSCWVAMRC